MILGDDGLLEPLSPVLEPSRGAAPEMASFALPPRPPLTVPTSLESDPDSEPEPRSLPGGPGRDGATSPLPPAERPPSTTVRREKRATQGEEFLSPPENFAMMHLGVYRGSFPSKRSLLFLERLKLRSILYLCPEEPPEYYTAWMVRFKFIVKSSFCAESHDYSLNE